MLALGCVIKSAAKILLLSSANGGGWAKISHQLSNLLQPDTMVTNSTHIKPENTIYYCVWHTATFWRTLGVPSKGTPTIFFFFKLVRGWNVGILIKTKCDDERWWKPISEINDDIMRILYRHYMYLWIFWSCRVLLCLQNVQQWMKMKRIDILFFQTFQKVNKISFPVQILKGCFEKMLVLIISENALLSEINLFFQIPKISFWGDGDASLWTNSKLVRRGSKKEWHIIVFCIVECRHISGTTLALGKKVKKQNKSMLKNNPCIHGYELISQIDMS